MIFDLFCLAALLLVALAFLAWTTWHDKNPLDEANRLIDKLSTFFGGEVYLQESDCPARLYDWEAEEWSAARRCRGHI